MRRLTLLGTIMLLSITSFGQPWPPAGMLGNGTTVDPWQITDTLHLRALADYVNAGNGDNTNGKYYILMNDLDLIGYSNWSPIGDNSMNDSVYRFRGNFDGNRKVVKNLTINQPSQDFVALFGALFGGIIQNLGVENCNVTGANDVGGLVGYLAGGSVYWGIVYNCYATGSIKGNSNVGGLIGRMYYSVTTSNSYATCNVNGTSDVGGLIGFLYGNINNCYATGNVNGVSDVGGLVGGGSGTTIQNCVAANVVIIATSNTANIDRIIAVSHNNSIFINNYAFNGMVLQDGNGNVPVTSYLDSASGFSIPMDTLKSLAFYNRAANWYQMPWNIQNPLGTWKICDGRDLPFLRYQGIDCYYDITATASNNGSIIPSGTVNVKGDTNQTFTFSADICYEIDSLWIDGVYFPDSIAAGSYTFNNVTKNHTIEVNFKRLSDTVIINDTICYGESYVLNGFNVPLATKDSVYFSSDINTNGCDSVTRLELTVNPVYNVPIVASICQGDSYNFFGKTLTTSGIYYDTLPTVNGCDSIIELTLTVNPVYNVPIVASICQGDSYNFFSKTLTTSGIYYDTLPTVNGCDSIIELTLTVNPVYNVPTVVSICQGDSYNFFGKMLTASGIYYDTLQNINGCDSIIELTLTVNPVYNVPIVASICQGDSYNFFGKTLTTSGIYYDTLPTVNGCDSIIELTLTVNPVYNVPIVASICQGDSYNFFGKTLTTSGIYYDTLPTVNGCDSIIELTLTVNLVYFTQIKDSIFAGSSYNFNDKSLTTSGIYYDTLQTIHGCDSVFELTLTVNPFFPVTDITDIPATATMNVPLTLTGTVIPSNATNQNIVWSVEEKGTTGAVITSGDFFAIAEGTSVIKATIENGKSIGTDFEKSFFITVSSVGISNYELGMMNYLVYPNPTTGKLTVKCAETLRATSVQVFDVVGQVVGTYRIRPENTETTIDISHLARGLYFLKVAGKTVKFVKE